MNGQRLKAARERSRHSQESLAEVVGIHQRNFSRYERGLSEPTAEVLARIANALNVSADYLLGLTDDPTPSTLKATNLSDREKAVIAALRRGEPYEAIKAIVAGE